MYSHICASFSYVHFNFSYIGKILMLLFDKMYRLLLLTDNLLIWQPIDLRAPIMRNLLWRRQNSAFSLSDPPPAGCDWLMPNFHNDPWVFCTLHNTGITANCAERKRPRITRWHRYGHHDKYCDHSLIYWSAESWVAFIYCKVSCLQMLLHSLQALHYC